MMVALKGYRTVLKNAIFLCFALAALGGFEVPVEDQERFFAGILALSNIINLYFRSFTDTKMGKIVPSSIAGKAVAGAFVVVSALCALLFGVIGYAE